MRKLEGVFSREGKQIDSKDRLCQFDAFALDGMMLQCQSIVV